MMSDLDETFTETSDGCSLPSDTISRSIRNVYVLPDSRKRLGRHVDVAETFTDTSDGCNFPSDTISRSIVLLESRKRHGGQEKP